MKNAGRPGCGLLYEPKSVHDTLSPKKPTLERSFPNSYKSSHCMDKLAYSTTIDAGRKGSGIGGGKIPK